MIPLIKISVCELNSLDGDENEGRLKSGLAWRKAWEGLVLSVLHAHSSFEINNLKILGMKSSNLRGMNHLQLTRKNITFNETQSRHPQ